MNNLPEYPDQALDDAIEALLAGDLSQADSDKLRQAATTDQQLAAAIVSAWSLRKGLDGLQTETVSAQLEQRLLAIPSQNSNIWQRWFNFSNWQAGQSWALGSVMAMALIIAIGVQQQPSREEILQASEELEIALAYVARTLNQADKTTRAELSFQVRRLLEDKPAEPAQTINL